MSALASAGRRVTGASALRFAPLVAVLLALLVAAWLTPEFYAPGNLRNVLRQTSILGVVAVGQTLVLLVAGIDLSVGAVMGVAMILAAQVSGGQDGAVPGAIGLALLAGLLVGLANAFLVVVRRVPPFVATLAIALVLEGGRLALTRGIPGGSIPGALRALGGTLGPVPVPALVLGLVALATIFVLRKTTFGLALYAIGANPRAARMSGIRVGLGVSAAYVACSLLAIVGGLLLSGYIGYVDRYLGRGFELNSIAAAVVGGVSLAGGRGGVGGALAGAALLSVLANVLALLGAGEPVQLIMTGTVIILAVALQAGRGRVARPRGGAETAGKGGAGDAAQGRPAAA